MNKGNYWAVVFCFFAGCAFGGLFGTDVGIRDGFWPCFLDSVGILSFIGALGMFYYGTFAVPVGVCLCGGHLGVCVKGVLGAFGRFGIAVCVPVCSLVFVGILLCGLGAEAMAVSAGIRQGDFDRGYPVRFVTVSLLGSVHVLCGLWIFRRIADLFATSL